MLLFFSFCIRLTAQGKGSNPQILLDKEQFPPEVQDNLTKANKSEIENREKSIKNDSNIVTILPKETKPEAIERLLELDDPYNDEQNSEGVKCIGPNTRRSTKGFCECIEGFNLGDPVSRFGCYRCQQKCHQNAYCGYPGVCICAKGLLGNGVTECKIPVPIIINVAPNSIKRTGGDTTTIKFYTPTNYSAIKAFCKFGNTIVEGTLVEDGKLSCVAPPSRARSAKLSVSFDSLEWSKVGVILDYFQEKSIFRNRAVQAIVIIPLVLLGIILLSTRIRQQGGKEQSDNEAIPFTSNVEKRLFSPL